MRSRVTTLAACLITLGCTAQPVPAPTSAPASTPAAEVVSEEWVRVPGLPSDDRWERGLYDVSAAGPDLAWAVGYTGWEDSVATSMRAWDGSQWRRVPMENASGGNSAVDSQGPRDAWMIGGGNFDGPFAQHWNGQAWRRHPLPTYGQDVAMDGRRVAVLTRNAVLTWNGAAFVTEAKLGGEEIVLTSLDTGGRHTWIVGWRTPEQPVVWHGRDGEYEVALTLPRGTLNRIMQIAPDDVWAVGGADGKPLLLHWDGRSWRQPTIPQAIGHLHSVTAFGPDDVWFAGTEPIQSGTDRPGGVFVLHWDGRTWTRERPPESWSALRAEIERIPGTKRLWMVVNVLHGDSESITTYRRS
ncbi:hypothetical protein [Herbidospora daliensis]|uniref:hypothetical protein n=1 Tax=Herbidospora daliensis TaxID=295585 RepID=UPI000A694CC6|nr:hypothetical protein [Herbidospora daliensis]